MALCNSAKYLLSTSRAITLGTIVLRMDTFVDNDSKSGRRASRESEHLFGS